jgi:hypothetical protein
MRTCSYLIRTAAQARDVYWCPPQEPGVVAELTKAVSSPTLGAAAIRQSTCVISTSSYRNHAAAQAQHIDWRQTRGPGAVTELTDTVCSPALEATRIRECTCVVPTCRYRNHTAGQAQHVYWD